MSAAEIKRGYLSRVKRGIRLTNNKRWVKLLESSQTRNLRLEIFPTEKSARDGEPAKEVLKLEEAKLAIRTSKHKYTFIIELNTENAERETLMFSSDSDTDADDWVDAINRMLMQSNSSHRWHEPDLTVPQLPDINKLSSLGDGKFLVTPTVYHERLHCRQGDICLLKVTADKIILMNQSGRDTLVEWSLAALRRYGNTSEYFQFEAGRRTTTGEGVFTMMTKDGQAIYDLVHSYTQELVRRNQSSQRSHGGSTISRSVSNASSSSPQVGRHNSTRSGSMSSADGSLPASSPTLLSGAVAPGNGTYQPLNGVTQELRMYESSSLPHAIQRGQMSNAAPQYEQASLRETSYESLTQSRGSDQPPTYIEAVLGNSGSGGGATPAAAAAAAAQSVYQPIDPSTRLVPQNSGPSRAAADNNSPYQPISVTQANPYESVTRGASGRLSAGPAGAPNQQQLYQSLQ